MLNQFIEEFHSFILEEKIDYAHGYLATFIQQPNQWKKLLDDYQNYRFDFMYQEDVTEGYTNGTIMIYLDAKSDEAINAGYHYELTLLHDDRYWGYCQCNPNDEGFNTLHDCCGNGCDWSAPRILIKKIEEISDFSFEGVQRDLWEAEDKLNANAAEHKKQEILNQVNNLDEQIAWLEKKKMNLLNEL